METTKVFYNRSDHSFFHLLSKELGKVEKTTKGIGHPTFDDVIISLIAKTGLKYWLKKIIIFLIINFFQLLTLQPARTR